MGEALRDSDAASAASMAAATSTFATNAQTGCDDVNSIQPATGGRSAHDAADTQPLFFPALWRQRRSLVSKTLKAHDVHEVLDIGCAEGALLEILLNDTQFTRLAGIDIDTDSLDLCHHACQPTESDYRFLRELPVELQLYQGSLDQPDERLINFEAITCIEVIEHLDPPVLKSFPPVVLGYYRPRLVIVSTPNAEFNIHFENLKYGTPDAQFRHDDHRFEWTRAEFESWSKQIAEEYGYSVEFTGVGLLPQRKLVASETSETNKHSDDGSRVAPGSDGSAAAAGPTTDGHDTGFCTQMAIFTRLAKSETKAAIEERAASMRGEIHDQRPHRLISETKFPYFEETGFTTKEIVDEVADQFFCASFDQRRPDGSIQAHTLAPIQELWSILRVRQICRTMPRLLEALRSDDALGRFELSEDGQHLKVLYDIPPMVFDTVHSEYVPTESSQDGDRHPDDAMDDDRWLSDNEAIASGDVSGDECGGWGSTPDAGVSEPPPTSSTWEKGGGW